MQFTTALQDHHSLRLVVLNACEGARISPEDPFSGVAQTLVRESIPAVIAMQFEITDDAAVAFAEDFYRATAQGYPVDAALTAAQMEEPIRRTSRGHPGPRRRGACGAAARS
jgi:CHAT domain-containing protein